MATSDTVRWFSDIRLGDVATVGGKNASLGELYSALSSAGRPGAEWICINGPSLPRRTQRRPEHGTDCISFSTPSTRPALMCLPAAPPKRARSSSMPPVPIAFDEEITKSYRQLESEYGANVAVAVRSSATAEDLPTASFAGQHESFLNVRGADDLFEACRHCFASIFTDRAISYRIDNGFDHFKVALSVGVMKMVRADRASSGVIFTLDTESGFRDVVFITGVYGLGENIVQGTVDPDEFYVHKPTFRQGHRVVLSRSLGRKQMRMVYARGHGGTTKCFRSEGRSRALLHRRRGGAQACRLRDHDRGPLLGKGRASDADGHRMGQRCR